MLGSYQGKGATVRLLIPRVAVSMVKVVATPRLSEGRKPAVVLVPWIPAPISSTAPNEARGGEPTEALAKMIQRPSPAAIACPPEIAMLLVALVAAASMPAVASRKPTGGTTGFTPATTG